MGHRQNLVSPRRVPDITPMPANAHDTEPVAFDHPDTPFRWFGPAAGDETAGRDLPEASGRRMRQLRALQAVPRRTGSRR